MKLIKELYKKHTTEPLLYKSIDINEHLPTLKSYAEKYNHITEMGVRWGSSTIALLAGEPNKLISYDIKITNETQQIIDISKSLKTDFIFQECDSLSIEIEQTDVLFIDTLHTYNQLYSELTRHSAKVNHAIILHDTVSFKDKDEHTYKHASNLIKDMPKNKTGLYAAVTDFINLNKQWNIEKEFKNNNGLMILSRAP